MVLLDGDHNWYTVHSELELLERLSARRDEPFPALILHNVDWPYGRRDRYDHPEAIPAAFRQPHRTGGVLPHEPQLASGDGLNADAETALYEHELRNGVRTALEDFLAKTSLNLELFDLPGFHGVAVLLPSELIAGTGGRKLAAWMRSEDIIREQLRRVEEDRVALRLRLDVANRERQAIGATAERAASRIRDLVTRLEQREAELREARGERASAERELEEVRHGAAESERLIRSHEAQLQETRKKLEWTAASIDRAEDLIIRAEQSRSWRIAHRLATTLRRLTFRRAVSRGSLAQAKEILSVAEESLDETRTVRTRYAAALPLGPDEGRGTARTKTGGSTTRMSVLESQARLHFDAVVGIAGSSPHRAIPLDLHGSLSAAGAKHQMSRAPASWCASRMPSSRQLPA